MALAIMSDTESQFVRVCLCLSEQYQQSAALSAYVARSSYCPSEHMLFVW